MRIRCRVPQPRGQGLDEAGGNGVLEPFGLFMHLVPAVAEFIEQERLNQAVPAHYA